MPTPYCLEIWANPYYTDFLEICADRTVRSPRKMCRPYCCIETSKNLQSVHCTKTSNSVQKLMSQFLCQNLVVRSSKFVPVLLFKFLEICAKILLDFCAQICLQFLSPAGSKSLQTLSTVLLPLSKISLWKVNNEMSLPCPSPFLFMATSFWIKWSRLD